MGANRDGQHGGQHQRDREQEVGPSFMSGLPHAGDGNTKPGQACQGGELLEVVQVASATADAGKCLDGGRRFGS